MDCSIIIPTFNRKKFSDIINLNIKSQTYPFIKEVIVADDGDDAERLTLDIPYTLLYYKVPRMTIGEKRNFLISKATGDYIANMDTDDFYNPEYISKSIFNLIKNNKQISGSADMLMYRDGDTYKQRCLYLDMLNEATMVFTKEYAETHKFSNSNSNEGKGFVSGHLKDIYETPIENIMICIAHTQNTIDKTAWLTEQYKETIDLSSFNLHLKMLRDILDRQSTH